MDTTTISFDRLPHVVSGLSAKIDRVLELLEKGDSASHSQQHKPGRRIVHAKEACTIIGKSLSTLYRAIKAPNDPIPSYKRGKLLYFYEDELYSWIENGRNHARTLSVAEQAAAITAGMKCSYSQICKALDRNKNGQSRSQSPPVIKQPTAPSAVEKVVDTGLGLAESAGQAFGNIFTVGPAYDPEEEAFIRRMQRRKRRPGRKV